MSEFDPKKEIQITWHIEDVQQVRPDLSDKRAMKVLLKAKQYHDSEIGINWDVLKVWADKLYPKKRQQPTGTMTASTTN